MRIAFDPYTRKRLVLLVALAAGVCAALVLSRPTRGALSAHYRVQTTEGRRAYLHALGWEIDPASEDIRETAVPATMDAMLADYNALQRSQGFDLRPYLGQTVTVVTYSVVNAEAPTEVTLWIANAIVIAGDVHTTAVDGEMRGIIPAA